MRDSTVIFRKRQIRDNSVDYKKSLKRCLVANSWKKSPRAATLIRSIWRLAKTRRSSSPSYQRLPSAVFAVGRLRFRSSSLSVDFVFGRLRFRPSSRSAEISSIPPKPLPSASLSKTPSYFYYLN